MIYLKQSTASQEVLLGPFVDSTDGVTAETGLTIANTDIKIFKAGATTLASKNSGGATHISNGNYYAVLDATDTDTVGSGAIVVQVSGALAVRHDICVLEEAVYDMLIGASALGYIANAPVNVAQVSGDSTAADNLETAFDDTAGPVPWMGISDQGTAQSATGTTLVLRAATPFGADDVPIGATLAVFGSTQGYWQFRTITDYVTSTDTATVETWTVTPSGTITYKIFGTAPSSGGGGLDAAGVRAAVGLASANLDTQLSTIDDFLDTEIGAIKTKTDFLPSAAAGSSGGLLISGSNSGTTTLAALTVTGSFTISDGLLVSRSTSNASAITATGNGTGHGAALTSGSGATGNGLTLLAASTNGHGLKSTGTGTGDGAELTAGASGADLDADQVGAFTGSITGNLSGSVGSVTGNVGGNVTGSVGTVNALAANVITAAATAADFGTEVGTAVWASADRQLTALDEDVTTIDLNATAIGSVAGAVGSVTGNVGGNVTGSVGSVAAGGITSGSFGAGALNAAALATDAANEIADAFLDRNMATGTDSGTDSTAVRTPRQALRALRNRVAISAGTATVYKEDDATTSYTGAVGTTAGDPISSINPS